MRLGARYRQAPVIRVPGQPVVGQTLAAPLGPFIRAGSGASRTLGDVLVQDRQGHVAQQWGKDRPLRGTGAGIRQRAILSEDARFKERLHQGKDAFVPDAGPHPVHKSGMRDFVEAGFDVAFHDPLIRAGGEVVHLGHRVVSPAVRAEPVGAREEIRLEDRLQHQFQGGLGDPVTDGGDPQVADLAARLGNRSPPHRQGAEGTGLEISPQFRQEPLHPPHGLDVVGGLAVHPSRARPLIAPHPIPRDQQERGIGDEIKQIIEPAMRIITGPTVQLGLDLQYPALSSNTA